MLLITWVCSSVWLFRTNNGMMHIIPTSTSYWYVAVALPMRATIFNQQPNGQGVQLEKPLLLVTSVLLKAFRIKFLQHGLLLLCETTIHQSAEHTGNGRCKLEARSRKAAGKDH